VNNVQRQRTEFDVYTSSGGYALDPTVGLGESAAWGPAPRGTMCELVVLDSNATFKIGVSDCGMPADNTQACKDSARRDWRPWVEGAACRTSAVALPRYWLPRSG
jgi:hypothetical protein